MHSKPWLPRISTPTWLLLFGLYLTQTLGQVSAQAPPPDSQHGQGLSRAIHNAASTITPSVVAIRALIPSHSSHPFRMTSTDYAAGSGVIFNSGGAILTNFHVIEEGRQIEVMLHDGRIFPATVAGTDATTDLAVLKITAPGLRAASFANSDRVRVGQLALALGAPYGLSYTLTSGVISARGRGLGVSQLEDYLQTDASISPGNSGGPLLDVQGRVVGINTLVHRGTSNLGFAIPSNIARRVAEDILKNGEVNWPWIGATFQTLTPSLARGFGLSQAGGALVDEVLPNSPALAAGLKPGDVIRTVDGAAIARTRDLLRHLLARKVGEKVSFSLIRAGKPLTLALTAATRPKAKTKSKPKAPTKAASGFGLTVKPLTPALARQLQYTGKGQLAVTSVARGGRAELAGLLRNDVILEANQKPVTSTAELKSAMADGHALLRIQRKSGSKYVMLTRQ